MYDLLIIGAGPAGLGVAIEAHKTGMKYCLIEKGGIVNSIQHFPTEMTFFSTPELLEIGNIPFTSAHMRPTRAEGLEYYSRLADFFDLELKLFETAITVRRTGSVFDVGTSKGSYTAKNIVIATGYYDNPNKLNIPGEDLPKVSHYYKEPYQYYKQNVVVIGGKNSAAIAALELYRHGAKVTLIHRGNTLSEKIKYWILPDIENRIKDGSVTAHFNAIVREIRPGSIISQQGDRVFEIQNDFVFALTGYRPDYGFLKNLGLRLENDSLAPIHDPETFETNIEGIFVAGSIVAGKNNNQIFIENGRMHGKKIIEALHKGPLRHK